MDMDDELREAIRLSLLAASVESNLVTPSAEVRRADRDNANGC
jgi:hypothetical protein